MTGQEIYALANEIVMDEYADTLDEPEEDMLIDRVCLTKRNEIAFVAITTDIGGNGEFRLPSLARNYRREGFRWLASERNRNTHSGIRFDIICIDPGARCGHLIENAF